MINDIIIYTCGLLKSIKLIFFCPGFCLRKEVFSQTDPEERLSQSLSKLKKEEVDLDGAALKREVRFCPAPNPWSLKELL